MENKNIFYLIAAWIIFLGIALIFKVKTMFMIFPIFGILTLAFLVFVTYKVMISEQNKDNNKEE
jgi:positive regulator of sigma E activity